MKQRAAVTFESEETVVLRQVGKRIVDFCPRCQSAAEMISPYVLALLAGSSEREIFRLIEAGAIHFVERNRTYACTQCYRRTLSESGPTGSYLQLGGELGSGTEMKT